MKIYCATREFEKALNITSQALAVRTTSQILEGVLIEVDDGKMTLTGTDTNMTIETAIAVMGKERAAFVIPARFVLSVISKESEEEIMLEYDEIKGKMKIKTATSTADVACLSADDFPKIKPSLDGEYISIEKEKIKRMIDKTAFSANAGETNAILSGILVKLKEGNFRMVALDSFRMAIYNEHVESAGEFEAIIPATMLKTVARIIDKGDGEAKIYKGDNKIIIEIEDTKMILNTMNGNFLDYERIIDKEFKIKIRAERQKLLNGIDKATPFVSIKNNNLVKLSVEEDIIDLSCVSDQGSMEEKIEIIKDGEDITIGFNAKYMMEALKVIEDEEILIFMNGRGKAGIIKPLKGDKYLYMILPVMLK